MLLLFEKHTRQTDRPYERRLGTALDGPTTPFWADVFFQSLRKQKGSPSIWEKVRPGTFIGHCRFDWRLDHSGLARH